MPHRPWHPMESFTLEQHIPLAITFFRDFQRKGMNSFLKGCKHLASLHLRLYLAPFVHQCFSAIDCYWLLGSLGAVNFKASTPSTPGGRCECHGCVLPPGWSGISASCDYFGLKILVNPFSKVDFHRLNFGSHNGTCLWDPFGRRGLLLWPWWKWMAAIFSGTF